MKIKTLRNIKYIANLLLFVILQNACTDLPGDPNSSRRVNNTSYIAQESFAFNADASNYNKLRLAAVNGNVTIVGSSNADSISVSGDKKVGSESTGDAQAHLANLKIEIQSSTSEYYIKTKQPEESMGRSYIVDYRITVPKTYEIEITLVNGNVSVDSIDNRVIVANVNGQVNLNGINGSTAITVVNGSLSSRQSLPSNGRVSMSAVNGSITLMVPQNTSADLSAGAVNGNISTSNLVFQNLSVTANTLNGKLGNGDGTISLSTVNGGISVSGY